MADKFEKQGPCLAACRKLKEGMQKRPALPHRPV
jgi:hypothetical protein